MSGEHIVSNAVFKAGCSCPVLVGGVNRIRGGQATRGAEKSNILCRAHNSLLSPLDETIGAIARFQANANDESFQENLYIEGEVLERWLLKTLCNAAAAGWLGPKLAPSPPIVRAVFGLEPVPDSLGLHSVDGIDPNHRPSGGISLRPVFITSHAGPQLAGMYVAVHGMQLFVSLYTGLTHWLETGADPELMTMFSPQGLRHLHRPGAIVMDRRRGAPVVMGLSWNGLIRYQDGTTAPLSAVKARAHKPIE